MAENMREVHMPAQPAGPMTGEQKLSMVKQQVTTQMLKAVRDTEKAIDNELESLDNLKKSDLENIRRRRMIELKKKAAKMQEWRHKGHGTYAELADEKQWFGEIKQSERTITLFYRNTTNESDKYTQILDKHICKLAPKHMETRFIKINAEKSPYLCQKLNIVLLPTILCTKDNFTHDRIEGFDPLGGTENFTTETLRARLAKKGTISYDPIVDKPLNQEKQMYHTTKTNKGGRAIYQSKLAQLDDDDDWDDISD